MCANKHIIYLGVALFLERFLLVQAVAAEIEQELDAQVAADIEAVEAMALRLSRPIRQFMTQLLLRMQIQFHQLRPTLKELLPPLILMERFAAFVSTPCVLLLVPMNSWRQQSVATCTTRLACSAGGLLVMSLGPAHTNAHCALACHMVKMNGLKRNLPKKLRRPFRLLRP